MGLLAGRLGGAGVEHRRQTGGGRGPEAEHGVGLRRHHGVEHDAADALGVVAQGLQCEVGAVGDAVEVPLLDAERHAQVGDVGGVLRRRVRAEVGSGGGEPVAACPGGRGTAVGGGRVEAVSPVQSARNASISGQDSSGSDFQVPRWSRKITSRSLFQPAAIRGAALRSPLPPGPPAR